MVDLPGHSAGHFGVAVERNDGWLLHAGDAYYDHREIEGAVPPPPGLRLFQKMISDDFDSAQTTQASLGELKAHKDLEIFCSHDPAEFSRQERKS